MPKLLKALGALLLADDKKVVVSPSESTGPMTGHSVSQYEPAQYAEPVRVRTTNPEVGLGGHVVSEPRESRPESEVHDDAAKMALFKRGGSGNSNAVPFPVMPAPSPKVEPL